MLLKYKSNLSLFKLDLTQFKVILTQNDCDMVPRKVYVSIENTHVYIKPLKNLWENLMGAYDARNTMIVND